MYDIVIVGAGPAGSTLARLLNKSYKILLIDKRDFSNSNSKGKCCGGLLAPDAQKILAQLGLALPKQVLVAPQMFSVKCIDIDNDLIKYYQRHYLNINRKLFDTWLLSLIPNNVELKSNCLYKGFKKTKNGLEISLLDCGAPKKISTKLLIGADGAVSKVRREICSNQKQPHRYISLQRWYENTQSIPHYVSVFDKEITDFYSWLIQKKNYIIVGTALNKHKNCTEKFDRLVNKLKMCGYKFGKEVKSEGTWIMRPRLNSQITLCKDNIALVGESAGLISPSSAEGISYALKSASMLAKSINNSLTSYHNYYSKSVLSLKLNIMFKNYKSALMYNQVSRKLIMKSGVLSMKLYDSYEGIPAVRY